MNVDLDLLVLVARYWIGRTVTTCPCRSSDCMAARATVIMLNMDRREAKISNGGTPLWFALSDLRIIHPAAEA